MIHVVRVAIKWTKHVDGIHMFPKLPVHIRIHREEWERNQRIRDALKKNKAGISNLRELNTATNAPPNNITESSNADDRSDEDAAPEASTVWLPPQMPVVMPVPQTQARSNHSSVIVDGTRIGIATHAEVQQCPKRKRGQRAGDKRPRKRRPPPLCARCKKYEPNENERDPNCKGRGGSKHCHHFDREGNRL